MIICETKYLGHKSTVLSKSPLSSAHQWIWNLKAKLFMLLFLCIWSQKYLFSVPQTSSVTTSLSYFSYSGSSLQCKYHRLWRRCSSVPTCLQWHAIICFLAEDIFPLEISSPVSHNPEDPWSCPVLHIFHYHRAHPRPLCNHTLSLSLKKTCKLLIECGKILSSPLWNAVNNVLLYM